MSAPDQPRVLLLHNRYRFEGGEERSLALQQRALANAGVEHRLLERRSEDTPRVRAAGALLRGGADEDEVARAVSELGADVVHVHNMQPLFGPRALAAARSSGARVILHLHNARLFCAIGVAARDGAPCYRCHGRNTLPGLVLNCRGSLPEAAAYAAGLARHQPLALRSADRFVAPSRWAAGLLARLGVPADKLDVLTHYLPAEEISADSRAHQGRYVLAAGRLAPEKGFDLAIAAAARASVPLWIAGDGPDREELESQAKALNAPVEFLGAVPREQMPDLLRGAAGLLLSSRSNEFSPFSVLEAMGAGLPVIATRSGGVPGLIGRDRCVRLGDGVALAARLSDLWSDPDGRRSEGERLLARVRGQHSERRYLTDLLAIYGSSRRTPAQ
jgi:glycosyltransferase involved in cell wall biosynthesis